MKLSHALGLDQCDWIKSTAFAEKPIRSFNQNGFL